MASLKTVQQETIATIDTAKALTDKVLTVLTIMLENPSLSFTFAMNPIGFLLDMLEALHVEREKIEAFITRILIWVVPALEISVKAILLTNLKKMISCSIDPRIPDKYRKLHKVPTDENTMNMYGIDINIESIDLLDKLSTNPLSEDGKNKYFGLEGVEDVYKFARADDFDAFLWFVMHKGSFPHSSHISVDNGEFNDPIHGLGNTDLTATVTPADGTLLSELNIQLQNPGNTGSTRILPGNTFIYDNKSPNIMAMCIDALRNENNKIIKNTIVPVSDDRTSVNWYIRRADQLGKNLGFGWHYDKDSKTTNANKSRNYSKEKPICNLQFMDAVANTPITGLVNNKIRFTILPKPYVHVPDIRHGEPPWRFKRMLFNAQGEYDPNGKYTIVQGIREEYNEGSNVIVFTGFTDDPQLFIDVKSGTVGVGNKSKMVKNLIECYPGLTVYEFNYDFVMGMKLFDAKVLTKTLIDTLCGIKVGFNLKVGAKHEDATERVKQIVRQIINSNDSEISDCYFTFDNTKYDALLQRAQEKRARQQKFGNVTKETGVFNSVDEILAEYDTKTDLNERMEVLHRAITQASVIVSEGSDESDKLDVQYGFVTDLVENLVMAIMNAILSPKLMLLLEVNQQLMGGTWEKISFEDILVAMKSIIVSIAKEVVDLIVQELLKFVMEQLNPIKEMFVSIIIRERLEDIASVMEDIIRNCPFIWFKFGNQDLETKLDTVDYADIDASTTKNGETPSTNNC